MDVDEEILDLLGENEDQTYEDWPLDVERAVQESTRESTSLARTPGPPLIADIKPRTRLATNARIVSLTEMQNIDPGYKARPPPRNLTESEIDSLLAQSPPVQSISREVSEMVTAQLHRLYTKRMSESKFVLSPSQEAYMLYVARQNNLTESARSKNGDMMGMKGVFSESCALTQATMKVKKKVTLGGVGLKGGIVSIKSLLHAQETPQEKTTNIHFRYKVTRRQVIDLNSQLVGVSLADLMDRQNTRIAKLSPKYGEPANSDNLAYNIAHDIYTAGGSAMRNVRYENYFLRIAFKRDKLYAHQLTPYKLAAILRSHAEIDRSVRIIPSAFADAFLDVFTMSDTKTVEQQRVDLYYIILEKMRNVIVQGIPKLERLDPKTVEYHQLFRGIREPYRHENTSGLVLEYNLTTMANHNYPDTNFVEDSLRKAGVVILDRFYTPFAQRLYAYAIEPLKIPLGAIALRSKLESIEEGYGKLFLPLEKGEREEESRLLFAEEPVDVRAQLEKGGIEVLKQLPDGYIIRTLWTTNLRDAIMELPLLDREYVYAVADGSAVEEICQYPWADSTRITTNSIPLMWKYFGIEVARAYFIYDYIANKTAVDALAQPRFTFIIADDMTFWGKPCGITFHENVKKKDNDFISLSTIGHPNQIYATYASKGGVALMTTNAAAMTATGEIFAGSNVLGTLKPTPESVLSKLQMMRTAKIPTHRNLVAATRQRTERMIAARTERFVDPVLTRRVVVPTILTTPEIVTASPITEERPVPEAKTTPSYVRSPLTESVLEDLVVPAKNIDSMRKELLSEFIVTQEECVQLLQTRRLLPVKVNLFDLLLRRTGTIGISERRRDYFGDYLVEQVTEEEEEEIIDFLPPRRGRERFVPQITTEVEMIL